MTNAEKFKEVFGFEVEDAYEDFWVEDFRMTKEQVIEYFEEQLGIFGIDCDHGIAMISAIELLRGEAELKHGKEQEPKTGHWILADIQSEEDIDNDNYRYICSECQHSDIHCKDIEVPYCWNCGAKMEGEEKE